MAVKPSLFGGSGGKRRSKSKIKFVRTEEPGWNFEFKFPEQGNEEEKEQIGEDNQNKRKDSSNSAGEESDYVNNSQENKEIIQKTNRVLAWISIVLLFIFPIIGFVIAIVVFFKSKKERDEETKKIASIALVMGVVIMLMYAILFIQLYLSIFNLAN